MPYNPPEMFRIALLFAAVTVLVSWKLSPLNPPWPTSRTWLYRAPLVGGVCGKFVLIAHGIAGTVWRDSTVAAGQSYCYYTVVYNVVTLKESGPSNETKITVP
jgi:hypothetical protein